MRQVFFCCFIVFSAKTEYANRKEQPLYMEKDMVITGKYNTNIGGLRQNHFEYACLRQKHNLLVFKTVSVMCVCFWLHCVCERERKNNEREGDGGNRNTHFHSAKKMFVFFRHTLIGKSWFKVLVGFKLIPTNIYIVNVSIIHSHARALQAFITIGTKMGQS